MAARLDGVKLAVNGRLHHIVALLVLGDLHAGIVGLDDLDRLFGAGDHRAQGRLETGHAEGVEFRHGRIVRQCLRGWRGTLGASDGLTDAAHDAHRLGLLDRKAGGHLGHIVRDVALQLHHFVACHASGAVGLQDSRRQLWHGWPGALRLLAKQGRATGQHKGAAANVGLKFRRLFRRHLSGAVGLEDPRNRIRRYSSHAAGTKSTLKRAGRTALRNAWCLRSGSLWAEGSHALRDAINVSPGAWSPVGRVGAAVVLGSRQFDVAFVAIQRLLEQQACSLG